MDRRGKENQVQMSGYIIGGYTKLSPICPIGIGRKPEEIHK
jgi:hypothetical protein